MRPGNQSNKRMRGRGRKGPNPLTRTYESNGPDVKIRGTAMHIAEKYQQLARDAQASGDRVMFESYNQHAEHYLRIVAAAQPQPQQTSQHSQRGDAEDGQEQAAASSSGAANGADQTAQTTSDGAVVDGDAPQPFIDNMPVIDQEGQVNGAAQGADGESAEGDEKPRRKTRTPRARAPRKAASDAASTGNGEAAASDEAPGVEAGEEPSKPRRRTTRPRRTKASEETPVEPASASE